MALVTHCIIIVIIICIVECPSGTAYTEIKFLKTIYRLLYLQDVESAMYAKT